jgi:hypothetical protein
MLTVVHDAEDANDSDTPGRSLLDEIVRDGARQMLAAALQAEVAAYVAQYADQLDENGHRLVVRNGYHQPREVLTAAGAVQVKAPRVNDKRVDPDTGERKRLSSAILPAWARKSAQMSEVLPLLYLHGLSTSDFTPALEQFLGSGAGLSATTITRLTAQWQDEARAFAARDLSGTDYVYLWVDGIHLKVRLDQEKLCLLVMLGVRADGRKELVAITDGYRESTESWADLLRDCKRRGMTLPESTPTQFSCCGVQFLYGTVPGGVVGALVVPAAVDDANPGAGEDSHGVGVVVSARAGSVVDVGCPSALVSAVVSEGGQCSAEAFVACPAEVHGVLFAGRFGDGSDPGQGGHGVGTVVGCTGVAPLGEHLGGVDLTRPWQRREDLGVRVLPEAGDDGSVEGLACAVERLDDADEGQHDVADGDSQDGIGGACGCAAQPGQQFFDWSSTGIGMLDKERSQAFLSESSGAGRGGIATQERQADWRFDVGEDRFGARPVIIEQGAELVGGRHPHGDNVVAGADHRAQRLGRRTVRGCGAQSMVAQAQVFGDHQGVTGIRLGAGDDFAVPPRFDGVRGYRDDRVAGFEQQVDQPPIGSFDPDVHIGGIAELGQFANQCGDAIGSMVNHELRQYLSHCGQHAHGMSGGSPVQPDVDDFCGFLGQRISSRWQRRRGEGVDHRTVTNWRSAARLPDAGLRLREGRGRRCHAGPLRATAPGRHLGPRRVPSTNTHQASAIRMVP